MTATSEPDAFRAPPSLFGVDTRALLDVVVEAFVLVDRGGHIVDWNRTAESTFGWTRDEVVGCRMDELLIPERSRAAHRTGFERFLAGEGGELLGRRIEVDALHRDGHEVPVELTLSVHDTGGALRVAAFLHDVSERKAARARLRSLAAIVESSDVAMWSATLDGVVETWNHGAEQLYGYTAEEMIGAPVARLRPKGDRADPEGRGQAIREGRSTCERTTQQRKDGSLVDAAVTLSPLCDEHGAVVGVASVVRDVTEEQQASAALAEAHARFAGAFEAATIGMALVAPDGHLLAVNRAFCDLLGRDARTLRSVSFQEITHPDDLEADVAQLQRILDGETDSYRLTKRYLLPGGGIVWGLLTVTAVRDEREERVLHLVAQVQDVTAQKTAEDELDHYAAQLDALAERDPVTGLANRCAFEAAVAAHLAGASSGTPAASVLAVLADADAADFARVVDTVTQASRAGDLIAHLGQGQLVLMLDGNDAPSARAVRGRMQRAVGAGARCGLASAGARDDARTLIQRAVRSAAKVKAPKPAEVPDDLHRLLSLARRQLGMAISFVTRIEGDHYVFEHLEGDLDGLGIAVGDTMPLAVTHCQRMLDGRIDTIVGDLAAHPETRDLDVTTATGLRAYAGVAVRTRSGELYGTLCTVDRERRPDLGERQAELLRFVADLAGELIDQRSEEETQRDVETGMRGVRTLLGALEARDFYTSEHSRQVVGLAVAVARRLGLPDDDVRDVEQVALLHDIGKLGIPDAVLQKQGPLDGREWQLMRQHPVVGEHIIAGTPGLAHLAPAMRAEHERWDGGGYPDGLSGTQIPLASRVTLACDALHAMTSDRPYRPAMPLDDALAELERNAGTQFDASVVAALLAEVTAAEGGAAPPAAALHHAVA